MTPIRTRLSTENTGSESESRSHLWSETLEPRMLALARKARRVDQSTIQDRISNHQRVRTALRAIRNGASLRGRR
jgi:hypothetical protein